MSKKEQVKTPKRQVKLDTVAALAAEQENGFTVGTLVAKDVPRCAVQRAITEGVLSIRKDVLKTGKRGRPAQRLTLTIKGRNYAKRAQKVAVAA